MPHYEYRILAHDDQPLATTRATSPTDFLAIQAARKLADGRPLEVWRGDVCVYASAPKSSGKPST